MTADSAKSSWEQVLRQTRAFNRGRSRRSRCYDLPSYYRALAYQEHDGLPEPIVRAHAFARVLDSVPLHRYQGEIFAGSTAGFVTPSLPAGLREKDYRAAVHEGQARGSRTFVAGWDHTLADYPTLLREGIWGVRDRAKRELERRCKETGSAAPSADQLERFDIEGTDLQWVRVKPAHAAVNEIVFLRAVCICLEALSRFAHRYAATCRSAGDEAVADVLERVADAPPRTLREAIQLVWLVHIALCSEGRHAMALGRVDQHLLPVYHRDMDAGCIHREEALGLFCHLWARVEELGEVTNICIGGLTPEGSDGTNELSYIAVEATRLVASPHTNLSARFHDATPRAFHEACFQTIRTGIGFPALFNDHVLIPGLVEIGIPEEVARDHCMVGCIETMLAGKQAPWSDSRFNTPLYLLDAMRAMQGEGRRSYERLTQLFRQRASTALAAHCEEINRVIRAFPPDRFPDPFLSALTQDCISRGRDVNDGGARYERMHGVCLMGLATLADSLAALKCLVFEEGAVEYDELMAALESNFRFTEPMRRLLETGAPKYGNDEPEVDGIAAELVAWLSCECLRHRIAGGGRFVAAMASNVQNISAGKEVGATPDGRSAGTPLSDAASPYYGRDRAGPTAFLRSVAAPDYHRVLTGSVVNMKFEPAHFAGDAGVDRFAALTRFFVDRRIQELQFNFTGNDVLGAAREHPEQYRNLVVRVSGFSAYYVDLNDDVQQDILRRRAHG